MKGTDAIAMLYAIVRIESRQSEDEECLTSDSTARERKGKVVFTKAVGDDQLSFIHQARVFRRDASVSHTSA